MIDPAEGPVAEQLRAATGGDGVRASFETSATISSVEAAIGATAKHGTIMLLASPRQPLPPILGLALARELEVRTTYAYRGDFPAVLAALAAGAYPTDGWVVTAGLTEIDGGPGRASRRAPAQGLGRPRPLRPTSRCLLRLRDRRVVTGCRFRAWVSPPFTSTPTTCRSRGWNGRGARRS